MDPSKQIDSLIERVTANLGMTRADLAAALEVTERSIARWCAGKNYPQYESRARLDELDALGNRLRQAFGDGPAAIDWMNAPNDVLRGQIPLDALREDRIAAVENALKAHHRNRVA